MDFPAKFGLAGLAIVLFLAFQYWGFIGGAYASIILARKPFSGRLRDLTIINSLLTNPFEDKGWTLGLVILIALVCRTSGLRPSGGAGADL